jgi:hypothetical protein
MPLIDFSYREGALSAEDLEWRLHRLTKTLMYREKMPDTRPVGPVLNCGRTSSPPTAPWSVAAPITGPTTGLT